jgi:hypothetical protein
VAGSAVAAGGIAAQNIIAGSFRQAYCPAGLLGRVTATMRFLVFGTIPLGALLAGALATALGARDALWAVLAGYALSGTLLLTGGILSHPDLPGGAAAGGGADAPPGEQDRSLRRGGGDGTLRMESYR